MTRTRLGLVEKNSNHRDGRDSVLEIEDRTREVIKTTLGPLSAQEKYTADGLPINALWTIPAIAARNSSLVQGTRTGRPPH